MNKLEQVNAFYEDMLSSDECRRLLREYAETIEGFVIFGANQNGLRVKRVLEGMSLKVLCFLDEYVTSDEFDDLIICHSLEELKEKYPQVCFILATLYRKHEKIMRNKITQAFGRCEVLEENAVSYCQRSDSLKRNDSAYIWTMAIGFFDFCTLKCRDCLPMTPWLPPTLRKHPPIEQLKRSIENLGKIVDGNNSLCITGGEPLLYPELAEVIRCVRKNLHVGELILITNGTLIPSEEVFKALAECQVIVRISDYEELSPKKNELLAILKKWKITAFLVPTMEVPWAQFEEMYDRGGDGHEQFVGCMIDRGYDLFDGKLYPCCRLLYQQRLNICEPAADEYIDLFEDVEIARKKLRELDSRTTPYVGCRFCGLSTKPVKPAIQIE